MNWLQHRFNYYNDNTVSISGIQQCGVSLIAFIGRRDPAPSLVLLTISRTRRKGLDNDVIN